MAFDFNSAPEQRSFELIPDGTIVTVQMNVRPGNAGEGGWLKRSSKGDSEQLDCELVVVEGPFAKRKFWDLMTIKGTTDGHAKAGEISATKIRAILEAVRGLKPSDYSEEAKKQRQLQSWGELDGVRFVTKIRVEKGKKKDDGSFWNDKNNLGEIQTPDKKDWAKVEQVAKVAPAVQAAAVQASNGAAAKPSWAS